MSLGVHAVAIIPGTVHVSFPRFTVVRPCCCQSCCQLSLPRTIIVRILRIYGTDVSLYDSFGVTKRTVFKCIIEWVEGDRWKLIDLDLTDLGVK